MNGQELELLSLSLDGQELASDCFHLTGESGCGAIVDADAVPIRTEHSGQRESGRSPLEHVLSDGEDFELQFTLSAAEADRLAQEQPLRRFGVPITRIGEMTAGTEVLLRQAGQTRPLPRGGFAHDW